MKKHTKLCVVAIVFLLLGGCYGFRPVDQHTISEIDYGPYPENYEALVKDYFSNSLKDPYSAVYRFNKPIKGYLRKAPIAGGDPEVYGYIVTTTINAKNSYGAYIGHKKHTLFIKNNLVGKITPNTWFPEPWYK